MSIMTLNAQQEPTYQDMQERLLGNQILNKLDNALHTSQWTPI